MIRIELTERAETPAPKGPARELARLFPRAFRVTPGWGDTAAVTPLGVVGEVEAGGVRWVARPKLPAGCLARLVDPALATGGSGDATPGLVELLAARLCELIRQSGPTRGYAELAGRSASVRGRIDFAELARDGNPFAPLPVVADEFTPDRPRNRAVAAAAERLSAAPLHPATRHALDAARLRFAGVAPRVPSEREWGELSSSSADELLAWARLVLTGLDAGGAGYLVRLEPLFERFVRDTLRALVPAGWTVTDPDLNVRADRGPGLSFRPDSVVGSPAGPASVWDAKWKPLKSSGPHPADAHQVLAYARLLGVNVCGLVYPGVRPGRVRYRLPAGGALWVVRLGLADGRAPAGLRGAARGD